MNFRAASFFVLAVLSTTAGAAPQRGSHWIVPARGIGQAELGRQGAKTLARLPRPDAADAGMSQTRSVWVTNAHGRRDTLFIHTVSNGALGVIPMSGVTIDTIRVTSPWYRTRGGIATGATLAQIRRQFPSIQSIDKSRTLFDAKAQGILFEFARPATGATPCIAINVHPRGDTHCATASDVAGVLNEHR